MKEVLGEDRGPSWLAREIGVSPSTAGDYLGGAVPSADRAVKIAAALNVTTDWLIAGVGPKRRSTLALADEADWLFVPRFDLMKMLAKGARPEPEEVMPIRRDLLARHIGNLSGLWSTRMIGKALPTVADPDDLILCTDVVDQLEEGRPYIVSWGDGLAFRRAYPRPDGMRLRADKDVEGDYEEIFVPAAEAGQVWPIGRILGSLAVRPAPWIR